MIPQTSYRLTPSPTDEHELVAGLSSFRLRPHHIRMSDSWTDMCCTLVGLHRTILLVIIRSKSTRGFQRTLDFRFLQLSHAIDVILPRGVRRA
jgi:hypothetical protein